MGETVDISERIHRILALLLQKQVQFQQKRTTVVCINAAALIRDTDKDKLDTFLVQSSVYLSIILVVSYPIDPALARDSLRWPHNGETSDTKVLHATPALVNARRSLRGWRGRSVSRRWDGFQGCRVRGRVAGAPHSSNGPETSGTPASCHVRRRSSSSAWVSVVLAVSDAYAGIGGWWCCRAKAVWTWCIGITGAVANASASAHGSCSMEEVVMAAAYLADTSAQILRRCSCRDPPRMSCWRGSRSSLKHQRLFGPALDSKPKYQAQAVWIFFV
ncbi:hypothetical protein C8R45DRAFT_1174230 [Mycena sanguinolenta]|nr:hypothetical protein C8R45DRAFT_1174230 [Mycena sanguinolenta]